MAQQSQLEVDGRVVQVSKLEKVMYPQAGFTKGQVIDYYVRIAPVLLPHLRGRPLTMKRYPEGVEGLFFYEKNCPTHRPEWVATAPVWSEGNNRWMDYCLVQDLPTLVWAANLADLELHTSLSLAKTIERPTAMVFDLDPGDPADIVQCCQVALWLRPILKNLALESFAKTSGSKGLQLYVPLNTSVTYEQTKPLAHALARLLEREHPELVVSDMKRALRAGKVFVDWSQNDQHKTTVSVYSLRAKSHPTVSMPVRWEEVQRSLRKEDAKLLRFESEETLKRVMKLGDLFQPVLKLKQKLPKVKAADELGALIAQSGARRRALKPAPRIKRTARRS